MLGRQGTVDDPSRVIQIVGIHVLVGIAVGTQHGYAALQRHFYFGIHLLVAGAQHGRARVLRAHEGTALPRPGSQAGQPVGLAGLLLVHARCQDVACEVHHNLAVAEKIRPFHRCHRVEVVVEIDELLAQTRDAVQEQLDGSAVERGQKPFRDDVAVIHDTELPDVRPCGHLAFARHHQKDTVHKGHVTLYATQQVGQQPPVAVPLGQCGLAGGTAVLLLPHGVQPVHVCNDDIHRSKFDWRLFQP